MSKSDTNQFVTENPKVNQFDQPAINPNASLASQKDMVGATKEEKFVTSAQYSDVCPGKHQDGQFPVTWLPAVVVSAENPTQFMMGSPNQKMCSDMMAPGTFVQLPQSYSSNSNSKMYGLVVGPNTVVPLDPLSLVNFPGFNKMGSCGSISRDDVDLGESIQNMDKIGADDQSPDDITRDIRYSNLSNDSPARENHIFCIYCQTYFKSMTQLQNHMLVEHTDQPSLSSMVDTSTMHPSLNTCPGCGHQLRKVGAFEPQFSISGPSDDDPNLNMAQTGSILMVCDNCSKEFTLGLAPDNSNQPTCSNEAKRHFCDHCEKSYKHNRDLRKHLRTHHGVDVNPNSSIQSSCFNTSGTSIQNNFQQEPATHPSKMVCHQCKKMFRGPFELRRHIHTVHENKRPYKCPECSKLFRDAYELKRHSASHQRLHYQSISSHPSGGDSTGMDMLRIQNTDNPNDIVNSSQNVGQLVSGGMVRDVYSVQSGGGFTHQTTPSDYYCNTCEKNFRGANEFKRHYSVVHEKKYRYKCIHCGKLWRDQYDLKRHCRRSHFVDRDIDRNFIRQCLLDNNSESNVAVQNPNPIPNYDMSQHVTLTLNQEAAAAIFGTSDQEIRNSASQLEQAFTLVDHTNMSNTFIVYKSYDKVISKWVHVP
ncbi:hypothetical protein MXB_4080 [Myxobolus squamalis]|nr:hypothetical protein MXB_4080 [Myxobolus squamalis]